MKMRAIPILFLIVLALSVASIAHGSSSSYAETDAITVVTRVIDGDTFDTTTMGRVRLADVDAPESYEYGYNEAKNFLTGLVYGETVYLDIDDFYRTDKYDRLVCVVYVKYNLTHYENVNEALLEGGYAVIDNYNNEFSPYTWTLYVSAATLSEFPSSLVLSLFTIPTFFAVILYRRRRAR